MQVTLARGNRAVEISKLNTSKFDLGKYARQARSGDRVVIEISIADDPQNIDAVIAIKVN